MEPVLHLSLPVADLDAAQAFYVDALGCDLGRVRDEFVDVWFFGMQLTLQHRPEQVLPDGQHGVRHFGVTLGRDEIEALLERLRRSSRPVRWITPLETAVDAALDGKTSVKLADPSGNVIELKAYPDGTGPPRP
jgi:hypothetical protein